MIIQQTQRLIHQTLVKLKWTVPAKYLTWINLNSVQTSDVSSNVAMIIAAQRNQPVVKVGNLILNQLRLLAGQTAQISLERGFLNFRFQPTMINQIIGQILDQPTTFGQLDLGRQRLVNYEWISANPTGYLHLGHARNAIVGMTITNLLEFVNYRVYREFYINDRGRQIFNLGKSIYYAYCRLLNQPVSVNDTEIYVNAEIEAAAKALIAQHQTAYLKVDFFNQPTIQTFFADFGKNFFLPRIKAICAKLNIRFDRWFAETELFPTTYQAFLKKLASQQLTYLKDGALWLRLGTATDNDDRVLVKSNQEVTYFFSDLMYHANKFDRKFEFCIDLWGSDHHAHYQRIKSGLQTIGYPADKFLVNLLQMVQITRNNQVLKMSKRAGTTFYMEDLYQLVGADFIKFMLLSVKRTNRFIFNLDLIKQRNAQNPLFYSQYAYARAVQIIKKNAGLTLSNNGSYELLTSPTERLLILTLHNFTTVIKKAAEHHEPFFLIEYVLRLSRRFHAFYDHNRIYRESNLALQQQRLGLVMAFQAVFSNIFKICGITTPEKM